MSLRFRILLLGCSLVLPADSTRADLIRLRSGGELRGTLQTGHVRAPEVAIDTLTGGTVVVQRDEIVFTTTRPLAIEEYETRARTLPPTVEAHWELAEWCRQKQLRIQRAEQLELILQLDPSHEAAHKGLAHVQENGEWMTRDEQMARRGYVKHKGRYVTQHEQTAAQRAAEQEWFTKVHPWVRWVAGNNERQRQQGIGYLQDISDPAAIPALVTHMSDHDNVGVRRLFVAVLGNIPGPQPVAPLVARSLFDGSSTVRDAALAALKGDQFEAALPLYVPALANNDNAVVNRAAKALAHIGDPRTVPALADALVTSHVFKISVPENDAISVGVGPSGVGFADPRAVSQYLPPNIEAQLRTGQLPFGVTINEPFAPPKRMKTVNVQIQLTNDGVRSALTQLTGRDFGFDERTWKLWWASQAAVADEPAPAT
jgi:hypothetical protein